MSINVEAVIVVGYKYDEIKPVYDKWKSTVDAGDCHFYEWKDDNDLTPVFPFYDASYEDCLFGTKVNHSGDYSYSVLNLHHGIIQDTIKDMTDKFGIAPAVYLSPNIG